MGTVVPVPWLDCGFAQPHRTSRCACMEAMHQEQWDGRCAGEAF